MDVACNFANPNQCFAWARAAFPGPGPLTLLKMSEDHTQLIYGAGDVPQGTAHVHLGYRSLADACISHWPPVPVELERAIDLTEERLMLATPPLRDATVVTNGDIIRRLLAGSVSEPPQMVSMTTEEVEQEFQRLASVSLGRPMGHAGAVANRYDAAALLLLRELMHHWGVAGIVLPAVHL
ncbi:MAG: hypothetical protein J0H27_03995 [Xanthomonadales bacterium]|nr:hypothetical protein [Xanthomonadales bacterium]